MSVSPASSPDALHQVLDKTRQRFVATFVAQCDSIRVLVDKVAAFGPRGPVAALTQVTHRLSGLAGTIGFPTISARAAALEDLVEGAGRGAYDARRARELVDAIQEAFTKDLASPPVWASPAIATPRGAKILVVENESEQCAIVMRCLEAAGYAPIAVPSGDLVLNMARAEKPALILLDVAMPRLDAYSACRVLKADPELADIPVIFMTAGASLDDKHAGLAVGPDEFLPKPVDLRELVLRIQLLLKASHWCQSPTADEPSAPSFRELTYDAFLAVASEEIGRSPTALALVRLPKERHAEGSRLLAEEIRGRDAIGACGPTRLLILMPEMTPVAARDRLEPMVDHLAGHCLRGICVGVTGSPSAGSRTVESLIREAGEALAQARHLGDKTAIWSERLGRPGAVPVARTVVVAEDDPDVRRIVDLLVSAVGYKAIGAVDGEEALAAVLAHSPDVLVLDLMMPKLDGFGVLTQLQKSPTTSPRPRIIVLSGRDRERDVLHAFDLGADDYMTKPFNPEELMTRIDRLLK